MSPTRLQSLRMASGLIALALLPRLLGSTTTWRVFGSWAILLQSSSQTRFPNDIDIEVTSDDFQPPMDYDGVWPAGVFGLQLDEARAIRFSKPHINPTAYWQTAKVIHRDRPFSEETLNWVHRFSESGTYVSSSHLDQGQAIALRQSPVFALALEELPDLEHFSETSFSMASREECVAQKWTRIATARSGERRHTRWQDLADVYDLVIGARGTLQDTTLDAWLKCLALERGLDWPCVMPAPPAEWSDFWDSYNYRSGRPRPHPQECVRELNVYLQELAT